MGRVKIGQFSVRSDVLAICGLALAGFVLGMVIARMVVGEPRVSTTDYVVAVSNVYERDKDSSAATDRLAAIGVAKPADTAAAIAENWAVTSPASQRDRDSVRELARGLGKPVADPARSSTPDSGPRLFWVLPLLVFLMFMGLAAIFAVKMLGVDFRDAIKWQRAWVAQLASTLQRRSWNLNDRPVRARPTPQPANVVRPRAPAPNPLAASGRKPSGQHTGRVSIDFGEPARTGLTFHARYLEGDDPYDEVHPIMDPLTGRMVGACGLTAGPRAPIAGPARCWGFTAWVQEYPEEGSSPVHAVGFISPWAETNAADDIEDWAVKDELAEVAIVEPGQSARLGVELVSAVVTPVSFDFTPSGPPDACFSELEVRFDVQIEQRQREPVGAGGRVAAGVA